MFGVDRFDAILPPGTVSNLICVLIKNNDGQHEFDCSVDFFL